MFPASVKKLRPAFVGGAVGSVGASRRRWPPCRTSLRRSRKIPGFAVGVVHGGNVKGLVASRGGEGWISCSPSTTFKIAQTILRPLHGFPEAQRLRDVRPKAGESGNNFPFNLLSECPSFSEAGEPFGSSVRPIRGHNLCVSANGSANGVSMTCPQASPQPIGLQLALWFASFTVGMRRCGFCTAFGSGSYVRKRWVPERTGRSFHRVIRPPSAKHVSWTLWRTRLMVCRSMIRTSA